MDEKARGGESRFAFPENSNVGIGFYDNDGTPLTPEEFQRRVAEDADKIKADEEARSS